jgi:peptidase M48-like protein/tellurite resistance protein TerB
MMKEVQLPPQEAIDRIRFASEQRLFASLCGDEQIAGVVKKLRRDNAEEANRRRLLASALRITDRIIPSLMQRVELAKRITHLEGMEVETYIHNSPHHSASCMHFEDGGIFLMISSGLYTELSERELLFVIGHELGHVVYQHHLLPARAVLAQRGAVNAERALKLMAWARRAEISADRAGLLCCQDLDVAAKALIKLSCGLSDDLLEFDLPGYVSQLADIETISRTVRAVEDFYSTHPFNPIRVVALSRFWESRTLAEYVEHSPGTVTDEIVNGRIDELLGFMDPDAATIQNRNVLECLVWGGFWVAASDGRIDRVEIQALGNAGKTRMASEAAAAIQKAGEPIKLIRERFMRAAESCLALPPFQRHAIVQQLIAVAKASLDVSAQEQSTLQEICTALKLNPVFPEKILGQYEDYVFAGAIGS